MDEPQGAGMQSNHDQSLIFLNRLHGSQRNDLRCYCQVGRESQPTLEPAAFFGGTDQIGSHQART